MSRIKELQEDLQQTETAQFVTAMLRDISATRLQSIRVAYERNMSYYNELHSLMSLIKQHARKAQVTVPANDKTIYIALTANRRFYGSINNRVISTLKKTISEDEEVDFYVVGQTGVQATKNDEFFKKKVFLETVFTGEEASSHDIADIIENVRMYGDVKVIHPLFINSFQQDIVISDLTHVVDSEQEEESIELDYIFEPDLPMLLHFFRDHIRSLLFRRILLETRVALIASRLMKMQSAKDRAAEMAKTQRREIHRQMRMLQNMRLLETFISFVEKK